LGEVQNFNVYHNVGGGQNVEKTLKLMFDKSKGQLGDIMIKPILIKIEMFNELRTL